MPLKLGMQTYQILTNDDEVFIPSLSSIFLAVSITFHEIIVIHIFKMDSIFEKNMITKRIVSA